jgi:hypothetical protein
MAVVQIDLVLKVRAPVSLNGRLTYAMVGVRRADIPVPVGYGVLRQLLAYASHQESFLMGTTVQALLYCVDD